MKNVNNPVGKPTVVEIKVPKEIKQINTSIPVFIGYTEKCGNEDSPIVKKEINSVFVSEAIRIDTFEQYQKIFGTCPDEPVTITIEETSTQQQGNANQLTVKAGLSNPTVHTMYYHMKMYFANGGGLCYVISVGDTNTEVIHCNHLLAGLQMARLFEDIAVLVVPQLVYLSPSEVSIIYQEMLKHAGELNRFAILDCYHNNHPFDIRGAVGENYLSFGAAYHPYLKTTLQFKINTSNLKVIYYRDKEPDRDKNSFASLSSDLQKLVIDELNNLSPTLPPSSAIAGVYANTDQAKGVWTAPANVKLSMVEEPTVKITNEEQPQFITRAPDGKSINLIRSFEGKGVLVIGARTLTGNDPEWKYVSMRRLFNMIEESIARTTRTFIFDDNNPATWVRIQALIENYLMKLWYAGILQGAQPEHAFHVRVGLGETMTAQDIEEGKLIIDVGVAPVIPAEFMMFKIVHSMKSK